MNGAAVRVYSRSKDGAVCLAPHFQVKEFACSDGTDTVFVSTELAGVLEKLRVHFGRPVRVLSGYRTEAKNKAVGGAAYSRHKYGMAADISVEGTAPSAVASYAETLLPDRGGIGVYATFVHVDVRSVRSRWTG